VRFFSELDIFDPLVEHDHRSGWTVRWKNVGNLVQRRAALFYDNIPDNNWSTGLIRNPRELKTGDTFCFEAHDAVLLGERAIFTADGALLTDQRASPPKTVLFPASQRHFESMETSEAAEGISSPKVDCPEQRLDGSSILLSTREHFNYASVLLRSIPKILSLDDNELRNFRIIAPAPLSWHTELYTAFGISLDNLFAHERSKSYELEHVVIPSQRYGNFYLDQSTIDLMRGLSAQHAEKAPDVISEKIYVSRRSQGTKRPNYRRCVNEDDVIAIMQRYGFSIIEPEKFAFLEQVAIFARARFIVGPSGAGMFNAVFTPPGAKVLSLEPLTAWILDHANLFASLGHEFGFIGGGVDESDVAPVHKRWSADLDALTRRLEEMLDR
jgi:hypothetical protein